MFINLITKPAHKIMTTALYGVNPGTAQQTPRVDFDSRRAGLPCHTTLQNSQEFPASTLCRTHYSIISNNFSEVIKATCFHTRSC